MKFFIAIMAVAFVAASEASYLPYDDVLSYQHSYGYGLPVSKVVYGSSYGLPAALDKYSYPSSLYGSYPAVKKVVEYPSVAPVLATKVVDNSYDLGYNKLVAPVLNSGYGLGYNKLVSGYGLGYNKLVAPVLSSGYGLGYNKLVSGYGLGYNKLVAPVVATKVVDNGLWNYGGYGLGYNKYLSTAPVAKYVF
ncbi:keratin-associated protein 6-2-like isoform X1 [Anopheles arabiensis]|uniref:keratin-associated protein 6-2-like n=1 Tax=Anopheles gambiae TaxID=7165 RepID=UPI001AACB7FE|nr:keratin-associated protein 6-2-like isoform X1 [Anopheles arabiensis]XP_061518509.1 keratin-associated protein 6-2-like [Anopheles gambiae]